VTGAADDDPSGIATYSQAGALFGLQLIWLSLFTLPFMITVQEMCARIGMVSGRGLAENIRLRFPAWALYFCVVPLLGANTINIAADLGAMAEGVRLLVPSADFHVLVVAFTVFSAALQVFMPYKSYARYLKYVTLVLFSYVAAGLVGGLDWREVLSHTFVPSVSLSGDWIFIVCAILGTTISPYLFFWQSSHEVEEEIGDGRKVLGDRIGATEAQIADMRIDVSSGMLVSNLVMFFIIGLCATTLFANGITRIQSAADAARALRPLAGEGASVLFAVGIIGTGLLAIPVLAGSSAYALAETLCWNEGLYKKLRSARGFYGTIVASTIGAALLGFTGVDPIRALLYSSSSSCASAATGASWASGRTVASHEYRAGALRP
jgi:NRAMP (natural resistance-associated macrophage protein)-like metal ion transporter